ncbi:MAG TPA: tetratricopeptide repeat protein [Candidatus Caenarcaniphilales bacterium]|nr:tetratricopeptide repeat protein [Candidatus Caenarcaniphilales bacterium]
MTTDTQLDTLEAKGLIRLVNYQPELEYLFRHWLVQDAAYGSLLRQERRELHRLVGEAIELLYPDRSGELAGILALHFEQAGDTEKALHYLVAEGHYALDRNALREAFSAFDRARALLPRPAEEGGDPKLLRRRVDIELGRARASWTFLPMEEVVAELDAIVPTAERLGDLELLAEVHLHLALVRLESGGAANDAALQRSLERVGQLGQALDDPSLGALPLALIGLNKVFIGPIREGVDSLERAIPLMERRRDFIGAAFARGWLAIGYANLGEFAKAEEASRYATEQAAGGDLIAQLDAQIAAAMVRSLQGRLDDALPIARACVERSQETGATACVVVSAWVLGDVYQRQGRVDDARSALELGMELAPAIGSMGFWRPTLRAWLGSNDATAPTSDPADPSWEESIAAARERGNRPGEASIQWKRAEALSKRGQWAAALSDFEASAAIWQEQQARPNLARVLRRWGEALRAADRQAEGDDKLRQALALFEDMGIEAEAYEVRQELAGLVPGGTTG